MALSIDPRTHDLADLIKLASDDYWLLKPENLSEEFRTHCAGVYRWGAEHSKDYRTEPGDGQWVYRGVREYEGDGPDSATPLSELLHPVSKRLTEITRYAKTIVADRLLEENIPAMHALAELIPVPEGWTREEFSGDKWCGDFREMWPRHSEVGMEIVLTAPDDRTRFILGLRPIRELRHYESKECTSVAVHVHVNFKSVQAGRESWFSYTRRGHDIAAYHHGDLTDFEAEYQKWLERVEASRAKHAGQVKVPGLRWHVTPKEQAEIAAKLQAGKGHHFMPASMGAGNFISVRRPSSWARPASAECAAFFGVSQLWVEDTDCD